MSLFSRQVHCAMCHSEDTHIIVSTAHGQFKSRFLLGRAYYCCACGKRGRVGGGIQALRWTGISLLSGVLALSLYGNFIGFQPLVMPDNPIKSIAVDPTLDPLLLLMDRVLPLSKIDTPTVATEPPARVLTGLKEWRIFAELGQGMDHLSMTIPSVWQPIRQAQNLLIATSYAKSSLNEPALKAQAVQRRSVSAKLKYHDTSEN